MTFRTFRKRNGKRYGKRTKRIPSRHLGRMRHVHNAPFITPNTIVRKLRFSFNQGDGHPLVSTSGGLSNYVYRWSSVFDPYYFTGGQQPYGFDQNMALYAKFIVLGAKALVRFFDNALAAQNAMVVYLTTSTKAVTPSTQQISEMPEARTAILSHEHPVVTLSGKYSYKQHGMKGGSVVNNNNLAGTATGDPNMNMFLHVGGFCPALQSATNRFTGYIDYIVLFIDPLSIITTS